MADQNETLRLLLDASAEGLRRELRGANAATEKFRRSSEQHFKKVDGAMRQVDGAAKLLTRGLGALGAAYSVSAIVNFTKSTIASADALAKTADRLGLTIEGLQELRFGAARSGVAVAALENSLQRFTRGLGEAQQGTGTMLPILKQYGVALRDSSGQARNAEAVLADYADAVQGAGSAQERLRLTFAAFGREGGSLVNLLKNGAAGLEDLRRQARDAGVVLDADFARKAEVLNDRLGVLEERSKVASTTLVLSLTPAIETVLGVYEKFSIGTANLINQFAEVNQLGLGPLEDRAESLRAKIKLLEETNPGDWFGTVSSARADLAEVEAQIERIRTGPVAPTSGPGPLGDLPAATATANDNLAGLQTQLDRARQAFDALTGGGSEAFEAMKKSLDVQGQAEKLAAQFNKTNAKLIDSGQVQARTAATYRDVLGEIAEVQERTTDRKTLDDYISGLTEEYGLAKLRLEVGEDEAAVQAELNQLRAQGVEITADQEQVLRRTIAATGALNDKWDANQKAIKDAMKAAEDAAADRDTIADEYADTFNTMVREALR